jgi:gas vesicle protein
MSHIPHDPFASSSLFVALAPESGGNHHAFMDARITRLETATNYLRHDVENLRSDFRSLRKELKGDIKDLCVELKGDIKDLRVELKGDINELRTELKGDIRELRSELKSDIQDLRSDISAGQERARGDFRLMFGALITLALGMAGLMARGFHWL